MSGLYISRSEADALKSIDLRNLERLVDDVVWRSGSGELHGLRLGSCGPYVSERLYRLDRALAAYNKAKAAKKREETSLQIRRAGMELVYAVRDMKNRLEEEEREQELVHVDLLSLPPHRFTPRLRVAVSYRWRNSVEDDWTHGSIAFLHEVDTRPDYSLPTPKRKPSRAKQEDDLQEKLYRTWDHLQSSALHSVCEYLRSGRDRTAIPEEFRVTTDRYSRGLNNYSTQFWREQS